MKKRLIQILLLISIIIPPIFIYKLIVKNTQTYEIVTFGGF